MKNIFPKWSNKKIKNGSYSLLITFIVIAIVILMNLVVGQLPIKYTKIDLSSTKLYTLGDKSQEVAKELKEDVTLYLITEKGMEDTNLLEVLNRYKDLSPHIKVVEKDPSIYPNFVSKYSQDKISGNSVIVESSKRSKIINYSEMYETTIDYNTQSSKVTGFDAEGQITSAIAYTASENLPIMYVLGGHKEEEISSELKSSIEKQNIEIKDLNLVSQAEVPKDAGCLFINAPANDISEEEAKKILTYLEGGGNAFITSAYSEEKMPNFQSVLKQYGIETIEGVVLESDGDHFVSGNPLNLLPNIQTHDITKSLEGRYILMPIAQAISKLENQRDSLTVTSLLTTSDSAYIKKDAANAESFSKEDGDQTGSFDLGVAITDKVEDKETKMVYMANSNMLNKQIDSAVSGGNTELLNSALGWMNEQKSSISIPSKSMDLGSLTIPSSAAALLSTMTIIILPLITLITGGYIWFKRRKR